MSPLLALLGLGLLVATLATACRRRLCAGTLAAVPGPRLAALSSWPLAWADWRGHRTRGLYALHARYGPVVRIAPRAVSFASLSALRAIYGAGSAFERTAFYRMFDVYGRQNLFTFASGRQHAARKKLVAHAYAKTALLRGDGLAAPLVADKTRQFLAVIEETPTLDVFHALHWFSLDVITGFLYGPRRPGGTNALGGDEGSPDRRLLDDILHPARRRLSWCAVHAPRVLRWVYGLPRVGGWLPTPTYTAIRVHARQAWEAYEGEGRKGDVVASPSPSASIMQRLALSSSLAGLDIASELADHLLAGIDTTSDTVLFALWALSRPEHAHYQARLRAEVCALDGDDAHGLDAHDLPTASAASAASAAAASAAAAARLPFLDAVLRETLRLYAPLPASEPRQLPAGSPPVTIDGVVIEPGTTVSMDPYTLHRNADVFPEPLAFRPERWLGEGGDGDNPLGDVTDMKRWFWAFSSGARMCIGMHLAMLEMTVLLAAVYRRYATRLPARQQGVSPGVVSRFEVLSDSTVARVSEHACWVEFVRDERMHVSE